MIDERETRLRARIDALTDERDTYKATCLELTGLVNVLEERLANALASHGVVVLHPGGKKYATDAERRAARRLSWRESKRRLRLQVDVDLGEAAA